MAYNITHVRVLNGQLFIAPEEVARFADVPRAEVCFLDYLKVPGDGCDLTGIPIRTLWWYGEMSGSTFETFKEVLAATTGRANLLIVWEGGDQLTGMTVFDGEVTEKEVLIKLGPK